MYTTGNYVADGIFDLPFDDDDEVSHESVCPDCEGDGLMINYCEKTGNDLGTKPCERCDGTGVKPTDK